MKTKMIQIYENNNTFGRKEEIYTFCINKNGNPDSMELDILNMIKDMHRKGIFNIKHFKNLFDYEYSLSASNIIKNIKPIIINITDNTEIIKNKIFDIDIKTNNNITNEV